MVKIVKNRKAFLEQCTKIYPLSWTVEKQEARCRIKKKKESCDKNKQSGKEVEKKSDQPGFIKKKELKKGVKGTFGGKSEKSAKKAQKKAQKSANWPKSEKSAKKKKAGKSAKKRSAFPPPWGPGQPTHPAPPPGVSRV